MIGARAAARVQVAPSVAEIERIGACPDPALRNLRITHAYHALSLATAEEVGPGANWCTFATWASKQAGQTIRGDDLGRKIEEVFQDSELVPMIVERLRDLRRALGRQVEITAVLRALRETCAPLRIVARVGDAVARGNKKVFDEIGREFARFLATRDFASETGASRTFLDGLQPGEPPDGQRLLAEAFRDYGIARGVSEPRQHAQRMLLANLRIGMHEQTRLQPEIAEALNTCVPDVGAIRARLIGILSPATGERAGRLGTRVGRTLLDRACDVLVERVRARVRAVITAELMTLALPGMVLRLGRDVSGSFPETLRVLADPDLTTFLGEIDPTPDTPVDSGTRDWADLRDRMHFIADLFRSRHEDTTLFHSPFTPDQVRAMTEGQLPHGDL